MHAELQSDVNGAIDEGDNLEHETIRRNAVESLAEPQRQEISGVVLVDRFIESLLEQIRVKDALIEKLTDNLAATTRPLPRFLDIGWGAFNSELIEAVGVWAEEKETAKGLVLDPEQPRVRVRGESFTITYEAMLALQHELGIPAPPQNDLHDKFAALVNDDSCFNKAGFGEPIFILRGQDALAAELIRIWAERAEALGCGAEKLAEARLVADLMDEYPGRKTPD